MNRFDAIPIPLLYPSGSVARYIVPITGTLRRPMWLVPPRHLSPPLDRQSFFFLGTVSDPFRDYLGACAARF